MTKNFHLPVGMIIMLYISKIPTEYNWKQHIAKNNKIFGWENHFRKNGFVLKCMYGNSNEKAIDKAKRGEYNKEVTMR